MEVSSVHWPGFEIKWSASDHIMNGVKRSGRLELQGCSQGIAHGKTDHAPTVTVLLLLYAL